MSKFAAKTSVAVSKSRAEVENILERYGADQFLIGWEEGQAVIGFRYDGRHVRLNVTMPTIHSEDIKKTPTGLRRSKNEVVKACDQAKRQRWRAIVLVVKAKLEAIESGIATFDQEFLAHIVLPDGRTYGQFAIPQIESIYAAGDMPKMLPAP